MRKIDPKKYRELSVPFASQQDANAALNAFFEDLGSVREKHKIANLHVTLGVFVSDAEGNEGGAYACCGYGDSLQWESLAAYALGRLQAERAELIGNLLKGKK